MARDLQSRLNAAAAALGPDKPPAKAPGGGTSYSQIPGVPNSKPYGDRPSQAVAGLDYDYKSKDLYVTYTTGSKYRYSSVPQDVYMGFATASSKGYFVNNVIKPGYSCKFISGNRKRAVSCP